MPVLSGFRFITRFYSPRVQSVIFYPQSVFYIDRKLNRDKGGGAVYLLARFYKEPIQIKKLNKMGYHHEDYETEHSGDAGFATGLLIGAALGAIAALLYAPKSGEETRQKIKDLADQQKDNLKNQWDRTRDTANEVVNTAKEKVDSFAQRASSSVDSYAEKAVDKVIQVADETKSTVDKFRMENGGAGQSGQA